MKLKFKSLIILMLAFAVFTSCSTTEMEVKETLNVTRSFENGNSVVSVTIVEGIVTVLMSDGDYYELPQVEVDLFNNTNKEQGHYRACKAWGTTVYSTATGDWYAVTHVPFEGTTITYLGNGPVGAAIAAAICNLKTSEEPYTIEYSKNEGKNGCLNLVETVGDCTYTSICLSNGEQVKITNCLDPFYVDPILDGELQDADEQYPSKQVINSIKDYMNIINSMSDKEKQEIVSYHENMDETRDVTLCPTEIGENLTSSVIIKRGKIYLSIVHSTGLIAPTLIELNTVSALMAGSGMPSLIATVGFYCFANITAAILP